MESILSNDRLLYKNEEGVPFDPIATGERRTNLFFHGSKAGTGMVIFYLRHIADRMRKLAKEEDEDGRMLHAFTNSVGCDCSALARRVGADPAATKEAVWGEKVIRHVDDVIIGISHHTTDLHGIRIGEYTYPTSMFEDYEEIIIFRQYERCSGWGLRCFRIMPKQAYELIDHYNSLAGKQKVGT